MPGSLFTEYFLQEGIRDTTDWRRLSTRHKSAFDKFTHSIRQLYHYMLSLALTKTKRR